MTEIVSIIIPTLERPALLARCLDSIVNTVHQPHEVICVSVEGDAETQALLAQRGVVNFVQPQRDGFVKAMNAGMQAATGTYIANLNDDCTLLPHTIANAIRFLEAPAHANVGQVAFFHDTPPLGSRRNVHQQICVEDIWYYVHHVRGLCYANFGLVRRTLCEQLGGYDERYFMYGADPDFSLKVWHEAKMIVAPCPGALVHHELHDDARGERERAAQSADNAKLFAKWALG